MKGLIYYLVFSVLLASRTIVATGVNHVDQPRFQSSSIKLEEMSQLMTQHKQKIEAQVTTLETASETLGDVSRKLHDVEEFIRSVRNLQDSQHDNVDQLLHDVKLLDEQMQYELAEKDARIAQLEHRIKKVHREDPYIEKFEHPIHQFWIAVDTKGESDWAFNKEKTSNGDPQISQNTDLYSADMPATLLILKSHELGEGFVYSEIQLKISSIAVRGEGAAGLIFLFVNSKNYWTAELSRKRGQGLLRVSRVSDGLLVRIAESPITVDPDNLYRVACRFTANFVSVFVDGVLKLEVDTSSTPASVPGSAGVFTRAGKASFQNFVSASPLYEKLAPEGAFEVIPKSSPLNIRKVSTEEELRMLRGKESPRFKQKDAHDDERVTLIKRPSSIVVLPRDYVDPVTKEKVDFLPDSSVSVPEEAPIPEDPEKLYRQFPAENRTDIALPVTAALCGNYKTAKLDVNDWLVANDPEWAIVTDLGVKRFTIPGGVQAGPRVLLLKQHTCNAASFSVKIRLEGNSEGGIVFRAADKMNNYMAMYNTKTEAFQLQRQIDGKVQVIQAVTKHDLNAQLRHKVTVVDHGSAQNGLIEVYIDDQPVMAAIAGEYRDFGLSGIVLRSGHGVFDSFEIQS